MKVFTEPKVTVVKFSDTVEMGISTIPEYKNFDKKAAFNTNDKIEIKQYDFFN